MNVTATATLASGASVTAEVADVTVASLRAAGRKLYQMLVAQAGGDTIETISITVTGIKV